MIIDVKNEIPKRLRAIDSKINKELASTKISESGDKLGFDLSIETHSKIHCDFWLSVSQSCFDIGISDFWHASDVPHYDFDFSVVASSIILGQIELKFENFCFGLFGAKRLKLKLQDGGVFYDNYHCLRLPQLVLDSDRTPFESYMIRN